MELSETLLQLKSSLDKFAKSRLLHIAEAAEELKVTEKFLIGLAKRGKVKAFKVGEHWFLEEAWLKDFQAAMKKLLAEAVSETGSRGSHHEGWTRQTASRRKIKRDVKVMPFLQLTLQCAVAAFTLVIVGAGVGLMCLPLAQVGLNRVAIANQFLGATQRVYSAPLVAADKLAEHGPINDEKITQAIYRLRGKNPPGQVAGAYEEKTDR